MNLEKKLPDPLVSSKLNVCHVFNSINAYNTGLENALFGISNYSLSIFVIFTSDIDSRLTIKSNYGLSAGFSLYSLSRDATQRFKSIWSLLKIRDSIVHCHHTLACVLGVLLSIRPSNKLCITIHSDFNFYLKRQKLIYAFCALFADKVIANSRNTYNRLPQFMKKKSVVIYNGINHERIAPKIDYNLSTRNSLKILSLSRLVRLKNVDKIIDSFLQIKFKSLIEMHIVGDGDQLGNLKQLASKLSSEDKPIIFHGRWNRKKIYSELSNFDILIIASSHEGFCNSAIEAAFAKVPIIASRINPFPELFGETIYYFDPCKPFSLLDTISSFLSLPDSIIARNAQCTYQRICSHLTLQKSSTMHIELYNRILH